MKNFNLNSEEYFEYLAENQPDQLRELLVNGTLEAYDLTFAAEIAGKTSMADMFEEPLIDLLNHPEAVVREGAIYGLLYINTDKVFESIKQLNNDPSPAIRSIVKGIND
jgi:hypothetical protein